METRLFFEKKNPAEKWGEKKNILQSIYEGKKYPAHQVARKKNLQTRNQPPPPPPQELNGRPL